MGDMVFVDPARLSACTSCLLITQVVLNTRAPLQFFIVTDEASVASTEVLLKRSFPRLSLVVKQLPNVERLKASIKVRGSRASLANPVL